MSSLRILLLSFFGLGIKAETCPMLYQRYSQTHTYCLPPKETCNIIRSNVKPSDIEIILREHNKYRSKIASGEEKTYSLPKASDMLEMVWDEELADVAQKHSEQCAFQHDCNECRRVQNFDVGQNLYERVVYPEPKPPDWKAAIKAWYDEVRDFDKQQIDSFQDGEGPPPTGHCTQVIWAQTYRIGCGYVLQKEENEYKDLYSCNYGPAGNIKDEPIYKRGEPCSRCPINSCCGKSCVNATYPGLCQISGNNAPEYKRPEGSLFLCTFNNEPDCARTVSGVDRWKVSNTLSGSYIGTVLNGGESSTFNFTKSFKGNQSMCLTSYFRKGPDTAGKEGNNTAYEIVTIPSINFSFSPEMQSYSVDFIKFSITLNWNMPTMLSVRFEVRVGADPQYLEIKDIEVREGQCS